MSPGAARTVLAFDFGLRRIGVAVGNTLTETARPLATLIAIEGNPDWQQIGRIRAEYPPDLCLVGVPCNTDGSEGVLALERAGFKEVYNVLDGFEGPLDDEHHRGTLGGWRMEGLPWEQL